MARNKLAGKHPSYKKRGMSKSSIEKKKAYDKEFSSSPEQVKKRMDCNNKRAAAKRKGMDIKDKDYDHATNRFVSKSTNRGRKEKSRLKKS